MFIEYVTFLLIITRTTYTTNADNNSFALINDGSTVFSLRCVHSSLISRTHVTTTDIISTLPITADADADADAGRIRISSKRACQHAKKKNYDDRNNSYY